MIEEVEIPDIGEKIESMQVIDVLVAVGDTVDVDQGLIEVETNKAVVDVPSPQRGKIVEIFVEAGQEVTVGQKILSMETGGKAEAPKKETKKTKPEKKKAEPKPVVKEEPIPEAAPVAAPVKATAPTSPVETTPPLAEAQAAPAAPTVRRLARELGVDIARIPGTGPGGRISREDVKAFVKGVMTSAAGSASPTTQKQPLPDFSQWGEITREPMSTIRSIIARSMPHAWQTVPHVTQFDEADITELEGFRKKYGKHVESSGGKLTVTAILMTVLASALKRFPRFNASIDPTSNEIIYKKYIHMGIAVDTERGLLVPVIRDVDTKNLRELSVELNDIAERTRNKKVKPDELEGGTFTISNQGGIGGTNFTPIVYWPQVAILGVSRSRVLPKMTEGDWEARTVLPLALSYDHRIVDGADAARFLKWIVDALEHPLLLNLES